MNSMQVEVESGWTPHVVSEELTNGKSVFVATHPSFPGVIAQGDSYAGACAEFQVMLDDVLNDLRISGLTIPVPNGVILRAKVAPTDEYVSVNTGLTRTGGPTPLHC